MALFQKKLEVGSSLPYTISGNKTVLIIGLGNPEAKFMGTRHNIGFAILDEFAKVNDFPGWTEKKDLKSLVAITNLGDTRVILAKPTTFVNHSGEAAHAVQKFFKVYNDHSLAVYDELAIPFGSLRTRLGGSDAGHNGVKSLIQHIGDDFSRLRIGIGNERTAKLDTANFVLAKFSKEEQASLPLIIREANSMVTEFIFGGQLSPETRSII